MYRPLPGNLYFGTEAKFEIRTGDLGGLRRLQELESQRASKWDNKRHN